MNSTCLVCPEKTYSVDPASNCTQCPSGGSCPGDGQLYPEAGYWRPSENFNGLFECPNKAACVTTHENWSPTGMCALYYTGNKCQSCELGASRSGPDKCQKCPSDTSNKVVIALVAVAVFSIVAVLTRNALKSSKKRSGLVGPLLKILLNYLHVMALAARFSLDWPLSLQRFFTFPEYAGNSGESVRKQVSELPACGGWWSCLHGAGEQVSAL